MRYFSTQHAFYSVQWVTLTLQPIIAPPVQDHACLAKTIDSLVQVVYQVTDSPTQTSVLKLFIGPSLSRFSVSFAL